ncbi:MAG TPA: glycosyltransferase family 2 protein [Thermoanaerobaculia bacterium]|nr:glycosyltransferase family 2 protein [Thermoanaerobaculia bacterium]
MTSPDPSPPPSAAPSVAVIIPCHDEAATIAKVVADFRAALPGAEIVVVDNVSRDGTAELARAAGARVIEETRKGKGFALLSGFRAAAPADYYVMVDGDDTYPAEAVHELLAAAAGADMVIGTRLKTSADGAFPVGHGFGNRLFILLVRLLFGIRTRDLFSGYRLLTQRFLKTSPLIAQGFEVEAELSMQALVNHFRVAEVPVFYRARPEESASKLRTFRDGTRILIAILAFFRDYRPLTFFGTLALGLLLLSFLSGGVVIAEYLKTGQVLRVPMAILAAGLFILGALAMTCGVLLSSINRRAAELAALLSRR